MDIQRIITSSPIWPKTDCEDPQLEELKINTLSLCEEASKKMQYTYNNFPQYTLHDEIHLCNLIKLIPLIMGKTINQISSLEKIIIILGVFFHDIGMALSEKEIASITKTVEYEQYFEEWKINHTNYAILKERENSIYNSQEEYKTIKEKIFSLENACLTDYLRKKHPENGDNYINSNYGNDRRFLFHDISLAPYIGKIALSHGKSISYISEENGFYCDVQICQEKINLSYIALIVRLADILDFDKSRTPDILYKSIKLDDPVSIQEWEKHRSIQGWNISSNEIMFTAECTHPVYENVIRSFISQIESELQNCINITNKYSEQFSKYRIDLPCLINKSRIGPKNNAYQSHDIEFSLSRNEIVSLLMTDKLYSSPSLCLRELLQNSADAIRTRKALYMENDIDFNNGEIIFNHYLNNNDEIIECIDNGVGMDMDIIRNYFTKVGRSYYKSPEFNKLRNKWKNKKFDFEPCSQFGIGFMSCFMIADKIEIETRRDYGIGVNKGEPLLIEINGTEGLFFIKRGDESQKIGTTVRLFNKNKKMFFGHETDDIHLIPTLQGYALAIEFPIHANCQIDEMKESITIGPDFAIHPTLLEILDVKNKITIKKNFNEILNTLSGVMQESFLIDKDGNVTLENEDGKWDFKKTNYGTEYFLRTKSGDYKAGLKFHSICFDGVLISGMPGRISDNRDVSFYNGWINPGTYNNASFCVDVRGQIKAEITPARLPVERGREITAKWNYIYNLINKTEAKIWEELIFSKNPAPETFWKLIKIYSPDLFSFSSKAIFEISVPIFDGTNYRYTKIKNLNYIFFKEDKILISETETIQFPPDILEWGQSDNYLNTEIIKLIVSVSYLTKERGNTIFKIDKNINFETMSDKILISRESFVIGVEYKNEYKDFLTVGAPIKTVNLLSPLFKLANSSKFKSQKDELESYSYKCCISFPTLCSKPESDIDLFEFVNKTYMKILAKQYFLIKWNEYDTSLSSFKVLLLNNKIKIVSEELFKEWEKKDDDFYLIQLSKKTSYKETLRLY